MKADQLRARQAPIKKRFRETPESSRVTLRATGDVIVEQQQCDVGSALGSTTTGLHRLTGGDGAAACSAQMLLESLAGCAGTTFCVVATMLEISCAHVQVNVNGTLDFGGTMGVASPEAVGFESIDVVFEVSTDADEALLDKALELTERYCVVQQSLRTPVRASWERTSISS